MKQKITKENINELYQKVNELINSYFTWKIKPSSLKSYLKNGSIGLKKFISFNELDVYENIEKIIFDVIDDRHSLELDGVQKFENFDFKIDAEIKDVDKVLYANIKESDIKYEKILADLYRISLSHVVEENIKTHLYTITTLNETSLVIIFSKEDLEIIKENVINYSYDFLQMTDIEMPSLFLKINLKNKIEKDYFLNMMVKELKNMKVEDWISDVLDIEEYQFKSEYKGYYIWEK